MRDEGLQSAGHSLLAAITDVELTNAEDPNSQIADAEVIDAVAIDEPLESFASGDWPPAAGTSEPVWRVPRRLWMIAAGWPVLGGFVWAIAAILRGQPRLLAKAGLAFAWPFLILTGVNLFIFLFVGGTEEPVDAFDMDDPPSKLVVIGWLIIFAVGYGWYVAVRAADWQWQTWFAPERLAERGGWPDPLARFDGDGGESRDNLGEASMTEFVGKPYWVAFTWWLLLGWAGAHRFYTGRTVSGLLYAASFGGCGAGWAADLMLLPMLAGRSLRPRCEVESMPAWAECTGRLGPLDFVLRLAFCLVAPVVFTIACVMYNHFELLAVLALVVIPCGLLGNAGRSLERLEVVAGWPIIGSALGFVRKLHAFYFEHAPRSFLYYLAYPLTCPLAALRSPVARREFGLYRNFVAALVSVVAIKYAVEYSATFPPFLGVADAFGFAFMHAVLAIFGTLVLLLPITTTAFTYHFTGRRWRLRTLAVLVLLVTVPAGAGTYWMDRHSGGATAMARMTLEFRMENEAFRRELRTASEMFLRHHVDDVNQSLLAVPSPVIYLGESVPTEAVAEHPDLTEKYRRLVSGLATRDEADAFRVFVLRETTPVAAAEAPAPAAYWIGIHATIDPPFVLAAVRPDGRYAADAIVTHWDELPSSVREHFEVDPEADAIESAPHRVAQRLMIDDWQ